MWDLRVTRELATNRRQPRELPSIAFCLRPDALIALLFGATATSAENAPPIPRLTLQAARRRLPFPVFRSHENSQCDKGPRDAPCWRTAGNPRKRAPE